jgi:hypothetical protein
VHVVVIALAGTMLLVPPWLARLRHRRNETRRLGAAVSA